MPPAKKGDNLFSRDDCGKAIQYGVAFTLRYLLDITINALSFLKVPFSVFFTILLLNGLLSAAWPAIKLSLSPGCSLPGLSKFSICTPATFSSSQSRPQWAEYARLLEQEFSYFDRLVGSSSRVGGGSLSLEVKRAEMTMKDLVSFVEVSNFRGKDTLVPLLSDFIVEAQRTGVNLQKLSSKIKGATDNIAAVYEYTLKVIERARAQGTPHFPQAILPWRASEKPLEAIVSDVLRDASNILSNNVARLVLEAEVNLTNLQHLEERLNSLYILISRENLSLTAEKRELLQRLWTRLGGNAKQLRGFNVHISLLKDLVDRRNQAMSHVVAVSESVKGMSEDMEIMRDGVAAPNLLGESTPAEVQIRKIEMGLQRLMGSVQPHNHEDESINRERLAASQL